MKFKVVFLSLLLLGLTACAEISGNITVKSVNISGNEPSTPSIRIISTQTSGGGVKHGGNIIFFYNRTDPQLYDTIGYIYWFIRNTNGNEFADMGNSN